MSVPSAMREFDLRGPLPCGVTLLEASAGTGKTFAIAALVAILGAEHPSAWLRLGGGCLVLVLATAAVRVERATGRRR